MSQEVVTISNSPIRDNVLVTEHGITICFTYFVPPCPLVKWLLN